MLVREVYDLIERKKLTELGLVVYTYLTINVFITSCMFLGVVSVLIYTLVSTLGDRYLES